VSILFGPSDHLALVLSLFLFLLTLAARLFLTRYLMPQFTAIIVWTMGLSVGLPVLLFWPTAPTVISAFAVVAVFGFGRFIGVYWQVIDTVSPSKGFVFELLTVFVIAVAASELGGAQAISLIWRVLVVVGFLWSAVTIMRYRGNDELPAGMSRIFIVVLLIFASMQVSGIYSQLTGSFRAGVQLTSEWMWWLGICAVPIGFMVWVRNFLDLTIQQQEAESLAAEKQLSRVMWSRQLGMLDRQRALGLLSSSLQHELRQPLSSMLINIQMFNRQLCSNSADGSFLRESLDHLYQESIRFYGHIAQIRRFIGSSKGNSIRVDAREVVLEVLNLMALEIRDKGIELRINASASAELMLAETDLHHLVLHGVMNALESIASADDEARAKMIEISTAWNGPIFEIIIADTGKGMSKKQIDQAGQEVFSTKHGRVGLGLMMMRQILDQANADWKFRSTSERFELILCFPLNPDKDESVDHV
jgi:signal transduction histidine kinase